MNFAETLAARHSVRVFDPRPVDEAVLVDIIRDAQWSPSCQNTQPWKVWLSTGASLEAIRERYRRLHLEGAPAVRDFPGGMEWSADCLENIRALGARRVAAGLLEAKEDSQSLLFHAPAVAYLTIPRLDNFWTGYDLGAFQQTLLLAAASRGIGSVPAWNLVKYPDVLREILGIPEDRMLVIGIALGYEADHPLNRLRSDRVPFESKLVVVS